MTTARNLRISEALFGGAVLGLGIFIAIGTARLEVAASQAVVGPKLFPYLIASGLIIVGLLLLREAVFGEVAHDRGIELDWVAVALVSAGLIAQMLLVEMLGWVPAAVLLFMATARAFGSRKLLLDAGIGLVLGGLSFVIFNYGLDLQLPGGILLDWLLPEAAD